MIKRFKKEILKLKNKSHVHPALIQKFLKKIDSDNNLVRDNNPTSHFCSFFLPINLENRTVFLGNHKKAGGWIPPGGHIQKGETPLGCVKREFAEELQYGLTNEKIELFDLSIVDIDNTRSLPCKIHYDFWYLIHTPKINFRFTKDEFYGARWVHLSEILQLPQGHQEFVKIFVKLIKKYS